jgi:hypothetical protein
MRILIHEHNPSTSSTFTHILPHTPTYLQRKKFVWCEGNGNPAALESAINTGKFEDYKGNGTLRTVEKRDSGISHHEKIPHLWWRMVGAMEGRDSEGSEGRFLRLTGLRPEDS